MNNKTTKKSAGFTLLETIISLLVVGMVMVQILSITFSNQRNSIANSERLQAYFLAMQYQDALEGIYLRSDVNKDWNVFLTKIGYTGPSDTSTVNGCLSWTTTWNFTKKTYPDACQQITVDNTVFTRSVTIKYGLPGVSAGDAPNFRKVDIKVSWGNPAKELEINYVLAKENF